MLAEQRCIHAVWLYHEHCNSTREKPTMSGYVRWWQSQDSMPKITTIQSTLKSWNIARTRAAYGPQNLTLNRRGSQRRWTDEDCFNGIKRYQMHCQQAEVNCTRNGYQEWQKTQIDVPSIGPIERRGSWNEMKQRAMEGAEGSLQGFCPSPSF